MHFGWIRTNLTYYIIFNPRRACAARVVQTQHSTFYCLYLNFQSQNSFPAKIELGGMEEEEVTVLGLSVCLSVDSLIWQYREWGGL